MKLSMVLGVLLGAACALLGVQVRAEGDPAVGKVKAIPCMGCHGIPGYNNAYPTYHVPRVGGQHAAYVVSALKSYKSGARGHATMRAQASTLSDQDMEDIAAYFESAGAR